MNNSKRLTPRWWEVELGKYKTFLELHLQKHVSTRKKWIFCSGSNIQAWRYICEGVKYLGGSCIHWLKQDLVAGNLRWWLVSRKTQLICSSHLNTQMWKHWKKFSLKYLIIHWMDPQHLNESRQRSQQSLIAKESRKENKNCCLKHRINPKLLA